MTDKVANTYKTSVRLTEAMSFEIEGGKKLSGEITINSSKNGAMGLLCAALLNRGKTTLRKVPKIEEVHRMIEVLLSIGVSVTWHGRDLEIVPPKRLAMEKINRVSAARTRSIIMFLGPLIHHFKTFSLPLSGGCTLGSRTVRPHLYALENMSYRTKA